MENQCCRNQSFLVICVAFLFKKKYPPAWNICLSEAWYRAPVLCCQLCNLSTVVFFKSCHNSREQTWGVWHFHVNILPSLQGWGGLIATTLHSLTLQPRDFLLLGREVLLKWQKHVKNDFFFASQELYFHLFVQKYELLCFYLKNNQLKVW